MCGIVGVVGKINKVQETTFKEMLFIDTLRGSHSTGIISVNTLDTAWIKKAVAAPDFLEMKKVNSLIDNRVSKCLVGHNRAATKGKVNTANAHPFDFGDIVGVHNGTLRNEKDLDYLNTDVDSERLFHHLSKHGIRDTVDNMEGAYALAWVNVKEGTLNLLRNSERPLHYGFNKDKTQMFFASEWGMLAWMDDRNNLGISEISMLPVHQHMKLQIPTKLDEVIKYSMSEVKPVEKVVSSYKHTPSQKVLPFTPSTRKNYDPVLNMYDMGEEIEFELDGLEENDYRQKRAVGYTTDEYSAPVAVYLQQVPSLEDEVGKDKVFKGRINKLPIKDYLFISPHSIEEVKDSTKDAGPFLGYRNKSIPPKKMEEILSKGCAWCSDPAPLANHAVVRWFSEEDFLCSSCQDEEEVKYYLESGFYH